MTTHGTSTQNGFPCVNIAKGNAVLKYVKNLCSRYPDFKNITHKTRLNSVNAILKLAKKGRRIK